MNLRAIDLPSEVDLDRESVRRWGLREFIRLTWPTVESSRFVPGWHLDAIAEHLEAVARGELRELVINVPPGCSKSTVVSVLWPAWWWTVHPEWRWMAATFDVALARRDALRMRALVRSPWYQARWPDAKIDTSQDTQETQGVFHTTAGGFRFSTTVGGGATGWHCHTQIVDDPIKPSDIAGDPESARAALERVWQWWQGTMASRKADPANFCRVLIMQRLHEEDLAGRCIAEGYTHLMLPMRFEPERRCVTPWGGDIRTDPGELLCPARFSAEVVARTEREMGSRVAAAQLQQRPSPAEGNIFKREWFRERWRELPSQIQLVQSWDCSFKDTSTADFVAGHVWGYAKGKFYLVDRVHARMGLPETVAGVQRLSRRHPKAYGKLIEDKANGPAVEQTLRGRLSGIIMVTPEGGKTARANAIAPLAEAGDIVFPDASMPGYEWADEVLEEVVSFPFARNDDDMDAMSQAVTHLHGKSNVRWLEGVSAASREMVGR